MGFSWVLDWLVTDGFSLFCKFADNKKKVWKNGYMFD